MKEGEGLDPRELAVAAATAADDKKAEDVVVLDLGELLVVTDYFVMCTASNRVLMKSVAEEVEERLQAYGLTPLGREGRANGGWMLVDFGGIILHVFAPESREFYRLEKLWGNAPVVDWAQIEEAAERGA